MPLFGKKKESKKQDTNVAKKGSEQITTITKTDKNGGTSFLTISSTTKTTVTQYRSVSMYSGTSSHSATSLRSLPSDLKLSTSPFEKEFAKNIDSNTNKLRSDFTTRKTSLDAKPFSTSGINKNYQSPYRNSSAVYSRSWNQSPLPSSSLNKPTQSVSKITNPSFYKPPIQIPPASKENVAKPATISKPQIQAVAKKIDVKKTGMFHDDNNLIPTYKTRSQKRGEALIINNVMFKEGKQREGAHADEMNLKELFTQLGFKIHLKGNLTKTKMQKEVKEFSKKKSLKEVDISVVIIMSHGTNHERLGGYTEIFGVDEEGCGTDEIVTYFTAENCPSMAGKPKIFLFQCCRGNNEEFIQSDARPIQTKAQGYADMLIAYSTLPGFVSHRDPFYGTWYIQTICDVFSEFAHQYHVEDLLKLVDERLAKFSSRTRQISSYESRGFKRCYLHPK